MRYVDKVDAYLRWSHVQSMAGDLNLDTQEHGISSVYRLGDRVALGGVAELCFATTLLETDAPVVVAKRLLPHLANDEASRSRFRHEAELLDGLAHPNIPKLIALDFDGNPPCMLLKYIPGRDLEALIRHCRAQGIKPTSSLVTFLCLTMSQTLDYLHRQASQSSASLLHRDVSPSNILLSLDGQPYLIDFGLAGPDDENDERTTAFASKAGLYPIPTASENMPATHGDIFALAISLLRFWSASSSDEAESYDAATWRKAITTNDDGDEHLLELLLQCTDQSTNNRLGSAAELISGLRLLPNQYNAHMAKTWFEQKCTSLYDAELQRYTSQLPTASAQSFEQTQALSAESVSTSVISGSIGHQEVSLIRHTEALKSPPVVNRPSLELNRPQETLVEEISREFSGRFRPSLNLNMVKSASTLRIPILIVSFAALGGALISKSLFERAQNRKLGRIMLDVSPSKDLRIFVDGQKKLSDRTPMYLTDLIPGDHTVIIQKEGFQAVERTITVKPDGLSDFAVILTHETEPKAAVTFTLDTEKCLLTFDNTTQEILSGQTVALPANRAIELQLRTNSTSPPKTISLNLSESESFNLRFSMKAL